MKQRLPRLFLAVMTVLCLWGAWLCPVHLTLPEFTGDNMSDSWYSSWYTPEHHSCWTDLTDDDWDALYALVPTLDLRVSSKLNGHSVSGTAGTIVHDLMVSHPDAWFWFRVNLVDGQTLAFIEQDGTRYRILNPEPLIEFLQSRVSFDV